MYQTQTITASMLAVLCVGSAAFAQLTKTSESGDLSFTEKLEGEWELVSSIGAGRPVRNSYYGRFDFKGDTLTIPTAQGDNVLTIVGRDSSDPRAVTMIDRKRKLSKVLLFEFVGDKLVISSSIESVKKGDLRLFPRPDLTVPDRNQVYELIRAQKPDTTARPSIEIRLVNEDPANEVVLDCTIKAFVGGILTYHSPGEVPQLGSKDKRIGTQVTGTLKEGTPGTQKLTLSIQIGTRIPTNETATVFRVETVDIETELSPTKTKRIACGGGKWCELTLQ